MAKTATAKSEENSSKEIDVKALMEENANLKDQLDAANRGIDILKKEMWDSRNEIKKMKESIIKGEAVKPVMGDGLEPTSEVEIAEVGNAKEFPIVLTKPSFDGKELLRYAPKLDDKDIPHYKIPLDYAEALLSNDGGRKYVLVSPKCIKIRRKNARHGINVVAVVADADIPSIM